MSDDDSSEPEWVSQHSAQKAALPRDLSSQSSSPVSFQGEGEGEGGTADGKKAKAKSKAKAPPSSSLPLTLAPKVRRDMLLLETADPSLDLSGDFGIIGRLSANAGGSGPAVTLVECGRRVDPREWADPPPGLELEGPDIPALPDVDRREMEHENEDEDEDASSSGDDADDNHVINAADLVVAADHFVRFRAARAEVSSVTPSSVIAFRIGPAWASSRAACGAIHLWAV